MRGDPRPCGARHLIVDFKLDVLDRRQRAKISIATTLKFFREALAHVAERIPDDAETVRLELDVEYWTADGKTHHVTLASPDRVLP